MSTFRVKLQQGLQGALDKDPSTMYPGTVVGQGLGTPFTASKQRQVYIMGPGKVNRLLKDGDTFTDCNYYKQFCYPYCQGKNDAEKMQNAILELVSDDGSVYSPIPGENTTPVVVSVDVDAGSDFTDNTIDLVATYGGPAVFCQIDNQSGADAVQVKLNGRDTAVFSLGYGDTQIFNNGDLVITELAFANTASGASSITVQLILSVSAACQS